MIRGIDVVYLHSPHRELGAWYAEVLGLSPGTSDGHWQEFAMEAGSRFAIDYSSVPRSLVEKQPVVLSFRVDDLAQAVDELASRGVQFYPSREETVFDVGPALVATLRDPDGNWVQLSQPKQKGREANMPESFEISTLLPASSERVYTAWLSSEEHAAFIGASAEAAPQPGARFAMWDGYIEGTNVQLEPYHRIVQSWRTTDFPPDSPDSRLEIVLEDVEGGTRMTLMHSNIPDGQGQEYKDGWVENYFEPMKRYFSAG